MTPDSDLLERGFELLRRAASAPDIGDQLEDLLTREMKGIAARRRRRRIAVAATALAVLSVSGGVAACGVRAIRDWFGEVKSIDVQCDDNGGAPRALMYDDSGQLLGDGRLPEADENGDYAARVLTEDE